MKNSVNLLENIKHTNIHIIQVPEGEEQQIGAEKLEAILAKDILTWERKQTSKSKKNRVPKKINPKSSTKVLKS